MALEISGIEQEQAEENELFNQDLMQKFDEFQKLLDEYNGVDGKRHGFYKFDTIKVISAGERDPDAEGASGMSASKMRKAAQDNDYKSFAQGLPPGFRDGKKLFKDVQKNMRVKSFRE